MNPTSNNQGTRIVRYSNRNQTSTNNNQTTYEETRFKETRTVTKSSHVLPNQTTSHRVVSNTGNREILVNQRSPGGRGYTPIKRRVIASSTLNQTPTIGGSEKKDTNLSSIQRRVYEQTTNIYNNSNNADNDFMKKDSRQTTGKLNDIMRN